MNTQDGLYGMRVFLAYKSGNAREHKLMLTGTGNDAVMAAATLAMQNASLGYIPTRVTVWFPGSTTPSECDYGSLLDLATQLMVEELSR